MEWKQCSNVKISQTGAKLQQISSKTFKGLHFALCSVGLDAETGAYYIRREIRKESDVAMSKHLKQERHDSKSQAKYSSNCILRCAVLCWFRLKQACTTFDVQDGMRTAFKSQNISNTSEIAVSSRQNIEEIAFCLLYRCELYAKVCWS